MRLAAINSHHDFHQLDHIAPLAEWLNIPLLMNEEKNLALARTYYPQVISHYIPDFEFHLGRLAENYDALIESKAWDPALRRIFRDFYQKKVKLIYCPHGQSDKGYAAPSLGHFATHDAAFVYGPLLQTMLEELQIKARCIPVGNYRLRFYQKHQTFYDALVEKEIFSRLPPKPTLLYAPTWNDLDGSTSFFQAASILADHVPDEWNLLVKVHPYLEEKDPGKYYFLASLFEKKNNHLLLSEFPPVYPLLARADAYLGDYSSIGYDFLYFTKPMFFLTQKSLPLGRLHTCGTILHDLTKLGSLLSLPNAYAQRQKELFRFAFGEKEITPEQIFQELMKGGEE